MSALVGRVIRERRDRAQRLEEQRSQRSASDYLSAAAESPDDGGEAGKLDERLALQDSCFLPCVKGPWLCNVFGLALIALGSLMCYFAFHSDAYWRLAAPSANATAGAALEAALATQGATAAAAVSEPSAAAASAVAAAPSGSEDAVAPAVAAVALFGEREAALAAALRSFLKSLAYLGPSVIGIGAFVIVVSCVMILDRRELIISALKRREAQLNKKTKDSVYAAVISRYVHKQRLAANGGHQQQPAPGGTEGVTGTYGFITSALRHLHCSNAAAAAELAIGGGGGCSSFNKSSPDVPSTDTVSPTQAGAHGEPAPRVPRTQSPYRASSADSEGSVVEPSDDGLTLSRDTCECCDEFSSAAAEKAPPPFKASIVFRAAAPDAGDAAAEPTEGDAADGALLLGHSANAQVDAAEMANAKVDALLHQVAVVEVSPSDEQRPTVA